ncbi:TPA: hypothetical protein KD877_002749 [Vibrio parahaemolyticus]|nr:hypothetical protein [Vibrio parahaemolyticus]HBN6183156.1 hypothetical protein [Vibrio parahaemolyticus]
MIKNKITAISLALFGFLLSTSYISFKNNDPVFILVSFIFLFIVMLIFNKNEYRYMGVFSFGVILTLMPFYHYMFVIDTGAIFTPGGDAKKYYDYAYDYGVLNGELIGYRYWFFIKIIGGYFKIINYLGGEVSPEYFSLLTAFVATLSVPIYNSCSNIIAKNDQLNIIGYFWLFTPLFVFLAVGQLRDIYTYFVVAYLYMVTLRLCYKKVKINNFILLFIFLIYVALIRIDVFVYCVFFILSYISFSSLSLKSKLISLLIAVFFMSFFIFQSETALKQLSFENFSTQVDIYDSQCDSGCDNSSFIKKLRDIPGGYFALAIISYFTPFPAFLFESKYNAHYFFELVFVIFWCVSSFVFLAFVWKVKKSTFDKAFIASLIFLLFLLAFTTVGYFRQKLYVYPIIYTYVYVYIKNELSNSQLVKILAILSIFSTLAVSLFFIRHS